MNILFITDLYPVKDDEKTTPKTLLNFVKEWEKQGHKVDVIKPNFILNSFLRGKPFYKTGKYGNVLNINYWTPFWFDIKRKQPTFLPSYPPTLLTIAHMPSGILFADKLGLSFVAGIHNSDLEVLTNPLYKFHFKKRLEKALTNAKAIACRSFVIKDKLLKLYPEFESKTFTAPSGIDEKYIVFPSPKSKISSLPQVDGIDCHHNSSLIKVLTCANFKKRKNIDKVIEACKGLEGFELTVIGDGSGRRKLENIDKSVKFTGRLSHDKVLEKMRESDIFILPSVNETFGMVYLEAMAQGCITICTKDDGIAGIIKDGENGFLTLPISSEIRKLLLNIKNLDDDSLKTLRYNSFQTIREYTSDKCAREYLQQIFKIL